MWPRAVNGIAAVANGLTIVDGILYDALLLIGLKLGNPNAAWIEKWSVHSDGQ